MKKIDLVDYAINSSKISHEYLQDKISKPKVSAWKIALAHAIDLTAISSITIFLISFYALSTSSFLTKSLSHAFAQQDLTPYVYLSFPLIMTTYFFCSYLLNDGQTWGMFILKSRIHMPKNDLVHSFRWSGFSISVCFSAGLALALGPLMAACGFGKYETQDHLYFSLIEEKYHLPIRLVDAIAQYEATEEASSYSQAA